MATEVATISPKPYLRIIAEGNEQSPWKVDYTIIRPNIPSESAVELTREGVYANKHIPGSLITHRQHLGAKYEDDITFEGEFDNSKLVYKDAKNHVAYFTAGYTVIDIKTTGKLPDKLSFLSNITKKTTPLDIIKYLHAFMAYLINTGTSVRIITGDDFDMYGYVKAFNYSLPHPWQTKWKLTVIRDYSYIRETKQYEKVTVIDIKTTGKLPDKLSFLSNITKKTTPLDIIKYLHAFMAYLINTGTSVRIITGDDFDMYGYVKAFNYSLPHPWQTKWKLTVIRDYSYIRETIQYQEVTKQVNPKGLLDATLASVAATMDKVNNIKAKMRLYQREFNGFLSKLTDILTTPFKLVQFGLSAFTQGLNSYDSATTFLGNLKQSMLDTLTSVQQVQSGIITDIDHTDSTITDWTGFANMITSRVGARQISPFVGDYSTGMVSSVGDTQRAIEQTVFKDTSLMIYTVKADDTWGTIAKKTTGDYNNWKCIKDFNSLVKDLQPGMRIIIPVC